MLICPHSLVATKMAGAILGDRALYHKRNKVKLYGERFGQGDVIGVTPDMDEGT